MNEMDEGLTDDADDGSCSISVNHVCKLWGWEEGGLRREREE